MNLGGGTHHAGREPGPRLLPVQRRRRSRVARAARGAAPRPGARRRLRRPPGRRHGGAARRRPGHVHAVPARRRELPVQARPSDLDVDLPHGHRRRRATSMRSRLRSTGPSRPPGRSSSFFLAGADPWEGDRLGRLALTKAGLAARDALVLDAAAAAGAPVASCSPAATRRTSATRSRSTWRPRARSPPAVRASWSDPPRRARRRTAAPRASMSSLKRSRSPLTRRSTTPSSVADLLDRRPRARSRAGA